MSSLDIPGIVQLELESSAQHIKALVGAGVSFGNHSPDLYRTVFTVRTKPVPQALTRLIGGFTITSMEGCTPVVTVTNSWLNEKYRGKGLGTLLHEIRLEALKKANVKIVLCTVNTENAAQLKILDRFGWELVRPFVHPVTNNQVALYSKAL